MMLKIWNILHLLYLKNVQCIIILEKIKKKKNVFEDFDYCLETQNLNRVDNMTFIENY